MSEQLRSATDEDARDEAVPLDPRYWDAARTPLNCLVFLFPLVAAYELGALMLRPEAWPERRLLAQSLIQQLVAWFGADAFWVPGAALLLTLTIWQIRTGGAWRLRGRIPLLMILESLVLALPLLVLGRLVQQTAGGALGESAEGLRVHVVLALGAAVYEELVFRFCLVGGLMWVLIGVCRAPKHVATRAAVALAALIFAACHIEPIGTESFAWPRFLWLAIAGGYLSTVFVLRGLGVTTGCHAAFNLAVVVLGAI